MSQYLSTLGLVSTSVVVHQCYMLLCPCVYGHLLPILVPVLFCTILIIVGQGPIALAVGAGGGCVDIFSFVYHFSFLSPSLGPDLI